MTDTKISKAYWWRKIPNFGDALAPLLLKRFANADTVWEPVQSAEIVSVGSVLEHLSPGWSGYILGAGRLKEFSTPDLSKAKILALRGPLSARGVPGSYALGDPGLLANELVGPQEKQYDLGIVPHWRDNDLVPRFLQLIQPPAIVKVISPREDPLAVIRQIGQCKRIVTSSLHGMIVADAFGIPRRVENAAVFSLNSEGGDFKFRDYSASIQTPFEFGKMMEPDRHLVEDVKYAIFDAYQALEDILSKS